MNQILITGNLGKDPEYKTIGESELAEFSLAHTPRKKDKSGTWSDGVTIWFRVQVWGAKASAVIDNLTKGATVMVVGTFNVSTYSKDGAEKSVNEINANEVTQIMRVGKKKEDAPSW
jgi:single-strand DNA-binding protein